MRKQPLTQKQQEVLDYIQAHIEENGYSPSWRQIADHFDTGLTNVRRYINFLLEKGHITRDLSTRPPSITVVSCLSKSKEYKMTSEQFKEKEDLA